MMETAAPISTNEIYLNYVKQGAVGILMGALQFVSAKMKLTPNDTLTVFFDHEHRNQSLNLMTSLLNGYIQTCCDEFCWIYEDVYIEPKISLKEALDLNGNHYVFSHFNKIFENSRSNTIPGPKHLNCLVTCTVSHYMPLLFPIILNGYEKHACMGGTNSSRDGNWSEAEKNVVRCLLQADVQRAIDWLNENKPVELKIMPFVCKDESCNKNWDLFNFPADKQVIAVQNIQKFRNELQQTDQQT